MTPQEPIGTFSQKQQRSLDESESKTSHTLFISLILIIYILVPLFNPLLAKAQESPNRQYASMAPNVSSSSSAAPISNDENYSGLVSSYLLEF